MKNVLTDIPIKMRLSDAASVSELVSPLPAASNPETMEQHKRKKSIEIFSTIIEENERKFRKMYLAALASLLNALSMGFSTSYTATALNNMKNDPNGSFFPDENEEGWIGSLLAIGALIGGMAAGKLSQTIGRRGVMIFSTIPFITGWLIMAFATSIPYLYAGRIITGFCCGLVSVTAPMYLVEISTPDIRGLLGSSFQLFAMIGVLIVICFGSFLHWKYLAGMGCVISVVTLSLLIFVPESPRWLMVKGKTFEAHKAIQWLQGNSVDASDQCKSIQEDIDNQPQGNFTLKEFTAPEAYKPALLSFALMFFQQVSGVNAIMFYTVDIFNAAGSSISSTLATIIVAVVGTISTFFGSILIDRTGRKVLLLISGGFMALSLGIFGGFEYLATTNGDAVRVSYGWLPVVCLIVFIAAFSIGFGPIAWLMVGEMTTVRLRSVTSGIATAFNWTCVFAITKTFHIMVAEIHTYGVYWFYTGICFLSCLFTIFLLPETKGKTFEEIQKHFTTKQTDFKTKMNN